MMGSIIFSCIWIFLMISFILYKKTEKKMPLITWLTIGIVLSTCYHTFIAGVFSAVRIPVNLFSLGIADGVIATVLIVQVLRSKSLQRYSLDLFDIVFVGIVVAEIYHLYHARYFGNSLMINYTTIDPAQHLKAAMDIVNQQRVQGMYHSSLSNAIILNILMPFTGVSKTYMSFVIADLLNLGLAGLSVYSLGKAFVKDFYGKLVILFLAVFYMKGYPLMNLMYGFVYLGMCVTIIAVLFILVHYYLQDSFDAVFLIAAIALGCLGVFECYMLFMPVTYFAIITCVFWKQFQKHKLVSWNTVWICLGMFLIPCIVGLGYSYFGTFGDELTVGAQFALEGATYRDLYTNFLFLLPVALWILWKMLRERENSILLVYTVYTALFVGTQLILCVKGKVSSYYFYKNYFLLWMVIFALAMYAVSKFQKSEKTFFSMMLVSAGIMAYMYIGNIEAKLQEKNAMLIPVVKSHIFFDVYQYNRAVCSIQHQNPQKVQLFSYMEENFIEEENCMVPIVSYWEDAYWYEGISNQRFTNWNYVTLDLETYLQQLKAQNAKYVLVMRDSELYTTNQEYFEALTKVYDGGIGYVAEVEK